MLIYYIVDMYRGAYPQKTLTIEDEDTLDAVYRKVALAEYGYENTPIAIKQLMTSGDAQGEPQRHKDYILDDRRMVVSLIEKNIEPPATPASEIFQEGDVINVVRRSSLMRGPDGTGALRGGARNRRRRSSRRKSKSKSSRRKSSRRKSSRRKSSRRKSSRRR